MGHLEWVFHFFWSILECRYFSCAKPIVMLVFFNTLRIFVIFLPGVVCCLLGFCVLSRRDFFVYMLKSRFLSHYKCLTCSCKRQNII